MTALDPPILAMLLAAPFVGSFLGTLALRLPAGEPVVLARSQCPHCKHTLTPIELVPLASWLVQRGRCRACGAAIGAYYPAMEIAAIVVVAWAAFVTAGMPFYFSCVLGWILLALSAMDFRTMLLSDVLNMALALGGLAATLTFAPERIWLHLAAGALALTAFALIGWGYVRWRGKSGLGFGDAKLFGAAGLWVGPEGAVSVLLVASFSALTVAVAALMLGKRLARDTAIPFGPFIALGLWLVWLYGPLELRLPG